MDSVGFERYIKQVYYYYYYHGHVQTVSLKHSCMLVVNYHYVSVILGKNSFIPTRMLDAGSSISNDSN